MGAAIDQVVASLPPGFRACYDRALQSDPRLAGKAIVIAKIASSGDVSSADAAQGTGLPSPMIQCLLRWVHNARFASPGPTGSTVQIPLTFAVSPTGG
jgi:hypothetical protein